jgi:UDP-N-acetylglucosamine--N-acetylmuramyl-(pentapeptide) pyrophosphoryl-undecaprenol N-acetylglucosamine transferase
MPIRKELKEFQKETLKAEALKVFNLKSENRTLFVFGGSQGAKSINTAIEEIIPLLEGKNIQVIHAIGQKNEVNKDLQKYPFYHPYPYIERMDLAYAASDLVLSRAGAMTIAEQSLLGIPAIYVPFAVGNGEKIYDLVMNHIFDENKLSNISQRAKSFGLHDADVEITNKVLELVQIGHK